MIKRRNFSKQDKEAIWRLFEKGYSVKQIHNMIRKAEMMVEKTEAIRLKNRYSLAS